MAGSRYSYSHRYRITKREKAIKIIKALIFNKITFLLIVVLILLAGGFYLIILSPYFQLTKIEVIGTERVNNSEVLELVKQEAATEILYFKTSNFFTVNTSKIEGAIRQKFILVSDIRVAKKFPKSIKIIIQEKKSVITLCKEESCFNFDNNGIPFEASDKPPFVIKISSSIDLNKNVLSDSDFRAIIDLKNRLQNFSDISIKEIIFKNQEGIIEVYENGGWKILFRTDNNINRQIENLKLVLDQKIPIEKRKNLEYIDLRFGDNIYFKYISKPAEETSEEKVEEKPAN